LEAQVPASIRSVWSEFKASNWLFSVPWLGGCHVSCRGMAGQVVEGVCVC